ncbi:hypothetical protein PUNSTDRAFT_145926 [Punctularia strigosozonata HHB-11173 SS5]|uniref:uncharacterized protein n=1 Tax=Punctularia strigosozonata (strain HHB-11173) TaxID=741275 RepID=UPI0004417FC3|nr:uncharacterized protein PUNSTDRAFT_145926 [Punctularia strigosozonata HHB-11173 SS5]EIN05513.1 hypothetical protein PUNSTDRAFT_145926 [Punctularia strigosozonata HHB-11173 SS5]
METDVSGSSRALSSRYGIEGQQSPANSDDLADLIQAVSDSRIVSYSLAASIAWLLYDIFITFPQELTLIWRRKMTAHKALYIVTRYYTLLILLICFKYSVDIHVKTRTRFCHVYVWFEGFHTSVFPLAAGDLMLAMRVAALYRHNVKVRLLIAYLYLSTVSASIFAWAYNLSTVHPLAVPPEVPIPGCVITAPKHLFAAVGCSIWNIITACMLVGMTFYKTHQNENASLGLSYRDRRRLMPNLALMARDGLIWFTVVICVLGCTVAVMFVWRTRTLSGIYFGFLLNSYATASCRLLLNLRGSIWGAPGVPSDVDVDLEDVPLPTDPASRRWLDMPHPELDSHEGAQGSGTGTPMPSSASSAPGEFELPALDVGRRADAWSIELQNR